MTPTPDLTTHALTAAERGWHVFPLRPHDKRPALHGEHDCPRTGLCAEQHLGWEPRATTDPKRIRACWAAGPFNVAVACGPSRLVVVDLDAPKDADDTPTPDDYVTKSFRSLDDLKASKRIGALLLMASKPDFRTPAPGYTVY